MVLQALSNFLILADAMKQLLKEIGRNPLLWALALRSQSYGVATRLVWLGQAWAMTSSAQKLNPDRTMTVKAEALQYVLQS